MLAGHWEGNPNIIHFKASGSGGASEMIGKLEDGEVMYGLGKQWIVFVERFSYYYQFIRNLKTSNEWTTLYSF